MSYLVTGGAGFIGSHLVAALVQQGAQVRVLDDLSTGSEANLRPWLDGIEFIAGDIRDLDLVSRACRGVRFVLHQAALASVTRSVEDPAATHAVCVTGTLNVLLAARDSGVQRVVYAGSSSAYGGRGPLPTSELQLPKTLSPYAAAKLAGEQYCEAFTEVYGLETVRLRYFNVFGPRQDPASPYSAVIPLFITAMLGGRPPTVHGDGEQSRDFTYIDNVVRANLLAAQTPGIAGRLYNIATGDGVSLLQLIDALNRILGSSIVPEHGPPRPGDVRHSQADIAQARSELGYEPAVSFEEGLKRTVDFYRALSRGQA